HHGSGRHVLGRPLRQARRPVRPPLVDLDAQGRRADGGDAEARQGNVREDEEAVGLIAPAGRTCPSISEAANATCAQGSPSQEFVFTRLLAPPRELVFTAWTDPVRMARWWGDCTA